MLGKVPEESMSKSSADDSGIDADLSHLYKEPEDLT